ncbi:MAG: Hsp20/alpha crystallin family protein [Alphaproteobacteria bacterium]|nr:Hsp20/alpha crystallin family protein [Alphaproteobacteria bacterium]
MSLRSLIPFNRQSRGVGNTEGGDPFLSLHREVNRLFDDVFRGTASFPALGAMPVTLSPRVDVKETDKAIEVTAEIPGVDQKDVEVELADGALTIRGEKKAESKKEEKGWHVMERSYGSFYRAIPLPFDVDSAKVDAKFDKGVLTVILPKPPEVESKTRKIAVKAG